MEVCIPFLIIFGMIVVLVLPIILIAAISAARRKKFQRMIAETKADLLRRGTWFAVRYASRKKYYSWLKIVPWEAAGILFISENQITFFANRLPKQYEGRQELDFYVRQTKVTWMTPDVFRNGFTSWVEIEAGEEKHYFTSETGTTIMGSGSSTKAIYEELSKVLG